MTNEHIPPIEELIFDLESEDESLRRTAIFTCAKMGEAAVKTIPLLQHIAGEDPSIEVRYIARKALNALAAQAKGTNAQTRKSAEMTLVLSRSAPETVVLRLISPDPNVRASAYRACAMRREPALLAALLERVGPEKEPDAELRSLLVRVLQIVGGKEALNAVALHAQDPDARVRANTVEVLGTYKEVAAYAVIARSLMDSDHRVSTAAVSALQSIGSLNSLRIGAAMMKSSTYWSRDAAAHLLAGLKLPEALPILEKGLEDSYESVRIKCRAGIQKLAELGFAPAKTLLDKISGVKETEAPLDFLALEKNPPKPLASVEDQMSDPDLVNRRNFTKQTASMWLLDDGHLPMLLGQLKIEKDPEVLKNLLTALGKTKNAIVVPILQDFVQNPEPEVRIAVADALASIGTADAIAAGLKMMNDASLDVVGRTIIAFRSQPAQVIGARLAQLAVGPVEARRMACMVIGALGEVKYASILDALAKDPDAGIAEMARDAARDLLQ